MSRSSILDYSSTDVNTSYQDKTNGNNNRHSTYAFRNSDWGYTLTHVTYVCQNIAEIQVYLSMDPF